jgi:quercetin dioxygenase-like cupin family protein
MRLTFSVSAGVDMHHSDYCKVLGATVFHCIEGHVTLKTPDKQVSIKEGQLVFLEAGAEHALIGVDNSVVLLTIVL